jgi:hypothetical protein
MMHQHHRLGLGKLLHLLPVVLYPNQCAVRTSIRKSTATMATEPKPKPPVAKKVEHVMEMLGDARIDNYYWLRDDSRTDPEVLSYLKQENAYTDSVMSGKKEPHFACLSVCLFVSRENKTSSFLCKVAKSLKMSCSRR